jgi:hypothetical protein
VRRFLHIGIFYRDRPIEFESLLPEFNKAIDWIRYAPNCWIVLTSSEPDVWFRRLKTVLHDNDNFYICSLDVANGVPVGSGFLPESLWDWFRKYSSRPLSPVESLPGPEPALQRVLPPPDSER